MADFNRAVDHVIKMEGGARFTNHPSDPGGATKFGITQKTLTKWYTDRGIDGFPVQFLHVSQARDIYKEMYWDELGLDAFKSDALAGLVFDQGVNQGVRRSAERLQRSINFTVRDSGLVLDGKIGPITADAANRGSRGTCLQFIYLSQHYYIDLVLAHPKFGVFLKGWINRTHALFQIALSW